MSISKSSSLKSLISSLDRSEKRHFSLYVNRLDSNRDVKFVELFEIIEGNPEVDDEHIMDVLKLKGSQQFANVKRHLFDQLLISLRLQHSRRKLTLELHEHLDYALLLKSKSLYTECLHYLSKCHMLVNGQSMNYHMLISDMQSGIHEILPTGKTNSDNSYENEEWLLGHIRQQSLLSKAEKELNADYSTNGFARTDREVWLRRQSFKLSISGLHIDRFTRDQRSKYFFCMARLHYINLDFTRAYYYILRAISMINQSTGLDMQMIESHNLYAMAIQIAGLYRNKRILENFSRAYKRQYASTFPDADRHTRFIFICNYLPSALDSMLFQSDFSHFDILNQAIDESLAEFSSLVSERIFFGIRYKQACILAMKGSYSESLDILNDLLSQKSTSDTRTDYAYALLLQHLCHYRLDNFRFVDNNLSNIRKHFLTHGLMTRAVELSLVFLRKGSRALNFGLKDELIELVQRLEDIRLDRFQSVAFLYFDFSAWFKSIRKDLSVEDLRTDHQ